MSFTIVSFGISGGGLEQGHAKAAAAATEAA
jgi:hypothetical protein